MIVHAFFENGVFRPTEPIELPDRCPVELVIRRETPPTPAASAAGPLTALAALAAAHPANPRLPRDLAAEHDHYLYGTPKRS